MFDKKQTLQSKLDFTKTAFEKVQVFEQKTDNLINQLIVNTNRNLTKVDNDNEDFETKDNKFDFAEKHAHPQNMNQEKKRLTKPDFAKKSKDHLTEKMKEANIQDNDCEVINLKNISKQNENNQPSQSIYQFLPMFPMPSNIYQTREGFYTCFPGFLGQNQNLMNGEKEKESDDHKNKVNFNQTSTQSAFPHLQNFMRNSTSQNPISCQKSILKPTKFESTNQQTAILHENKEKIEQFKNWTKENKNIANGLEFFFDKKAYIYNSQILCIQIRQGKCFLEEEKPHLKFFLVFKNLSRNKFTNMSIKLSTTSKNYTLMANLKRLESILETLSEQKLSFVIFPNELPVDELKLSVQFETTDSENGDKLKKVDLSLKISIPFNKFLKFKACEKINEKNFSDEKMSSMRKTVFYDQKLIRFPDEICSLFVGVKKVKTEREKKFINVYKGRFYFLLDLKMREFLFEAVFSEKKSTIDFSISSNFIENGFQDDFQAVIVNEMETMLKNNA